MIREAGFVAEQETTSKNPLLEGPELVSSEEERKQECEMSFSFSSDTRRYRLGYKDSKPFLVVEYFDSLPDEFDETEKTKFIREMKMQDGIKKVVYVLKYGEVLEPKEEIEEESDPSQSKIYRVAQPRDFERDMMGRFFADEINKEAMIKILAGNSELDFEEISQIVEQFFEAAHKQDRATIDTLSGRFSKEVSEKVRNGVREKILPKPQKMEMKRLAEVLKNKKVLFYSGAGISMASGVHNMDQLQKMLGIEMSEKTDALLKRAVINPQDVIDSWEEFTKAAFEKPATPAHQSLGKLARKTRSQIFTENVDFLQERAGVKSIHVTGPWLKEHIQPEWLKDIDAVITVGLSFDDRGFLGWYKENNPNGKIVAINIDQPPYLGNEDYLLEGDCQKVIPEIEAELSR